MPAAETLVIDGLLYEKGADGCYRAVAGARPVQATTTRASVGHTHTCARGHTWDHSVTAGHSCPTCGLEQWVQDSVARPVAVGSAGQVQTYALPRASAGGCPNGNCPTGLQPTARFAVPRR